MHQASGTVRRRRWRCPCPAIRGLLGTLYGQIAGALLAIIGIWAGLVAAIGESPRPSVVLASLGLALVFALVAVWVLTRPLRALLRSVTELRQSDYRRSAVPRPLPGPASAEVAGLERACRELTERLTREARVSGQAEACVQALLAATSREMQAPLAAVEVALERLSGREGPLSGHAREAALASALQGTGRAMRLAHAAAALARLYAPEARARPGPVALEAVVEGVARRLRPQAGTLGVELELRAPACLPLVAADHELVSEGMLHLIEHALDHCPTGGRVRVALQEAREGVRALVSGIEAGLPSGVSTGGLPPISAAHAPATPADDLALAIARRVVALHGGELRVGDAPGLPASYAFTLPRAAGDG